MTASKSGHPDIPDKGWSNPFPEGHPLHGLFERRIRNNQDLVILIDDYHARRGTGKTVASLQLAEGMDQNGGLTWENVSLRPEQIRNAYASLPKRSGIILDEGELGASNREAMTITNRALREIMSIGRIEEKYVVINAPATDFIDKDLLKMADVWISMLRKGAGLVHFYKRNPYASGSGNLMTKKMGLIEFEDIEKGTRLRDVYNKLTREKEGHIDGEEGQRFIPKNEHEKELQDARKQVRQETRNEVIRDVYNGLSGFDDDDYNRMKRADGVSQAMIADAIGLSQPQVGNILRGGQ